MSDAEAMSKPLANRFDSEFLSLLKKRVEHMGKEQDFKWALMRLSSTESPIGSFDEHPERHSICLKNFHLDGTT